MFPVVLVDTGGRLLRKENGQERCVKVFKAYGGDLDKSRG